MYGKLIVSAVESRRMQAVIGPFGCGKSHLVRESIERWPFHRKLHQVYVNHADRERLRIGHFLTAIIGELSEERPYRDSIARQNQAARLIGERVINLGHEVVVVVENAHRMHGNTMLALKDLRESLMYRGQAFLFSVILVGQEQLRSKLERYGEVRYRTSWVDLDAKDWMNFEDRLDYLADVYGDVITPDARHHLAKIPTILQMDALIEDRLRQIQKLGRTVLEESMLDLGIEWELKQLGRTQSDLARKSGVPKSTVSDVVRGVNTDPDTRERLDAAIQEMIAEKNGPSARRLAS